MMTTAFARRASLQSSHLFDRTLYRRGVEVAIWGMPIVSVDAMRQAFFRDARARYGDIVFWSKPADAKFQFTTPNASTYYVYFNYNMRQGPLVLEVPETAGARLSGSFASSTALHAWWMRNRSSSATWWRWDSCTQSASRRADPSRPIGPRAMFSSALQTKRT